MMEIRMREKPIKPSYDILKVFDTIRVNTNPARKVLRVIQQRSRMVQIMYHIINCRALNI